MPRRGKGHANETTAAERHKIATPKDIQKAQKRSRASAATTTKKKWLTTEEAKNKRTDHAQAHHRARVTKETPWDEEKKKLEQKWGKVGYNYSKKQYDTLLAVQRRPVHRLCSRSSPKSTSSPIIGAQHVREAGERP